MTAEPGKVLVLGGTGFVGSQVSQALLRQGYQVTTVSRRASSEALSVRTTMQRLPDCPCIS
jgi:nucleoside-diphosphate-sugar epimerase